jgi:hypothetical protein
MIRVRAGHYRDQFRNISYEVFRDRCVLGTRTVKGWRWRAHDMAEQLDFYRTKDEASFRARRAIHEQPR